MEFTVEQIMDYQTLLKERGYYTGEIDGIIGPLTRAAAEAMINSDKPTDIDALEGENIIDEKSYRFIKPLGKALDAITETTGLVYGTDVDTEETEKEETEEEEPEELYNAIGQIGPAGESNAGYEFKFKKPPGFGTNPGVSNIGDPDPDPVEPQDDGEGDVSTGFQDTQLWELDGATYVVFPVPGTDLYLRYLADDETLDLYYSSGREKPDVISKSVDDEEWVNSSFFGDLAEVDKDILKGDKEPFVGLADKFDVAKKYRPWLEDDELYNIWLEAFIEDRDILDEEWKTTEWWRTHTQEQRDWLLLSQGQDLSSLPADATAYLNNNIIKFRDMFKAAGVTNIEDIVNTDGESFLDWFSFNFTSGDWTELYTLDQLKAIADPSTGIEQDEAITTWMQGKAEGVDVSTTKQFEAQVENLANEWLGPLYGVLTDDQKSNYAALIRNAESEEIGASNVIDKLKGIRGTLFGDYDENLTYNEIATPWRNYSFQLLGQRMDETDATFVDVIKANDQKTATTMLTEWGINNNATTLLDKVTDEIGQALGAGQVVRGVAT